MSKTYRLPLGGLTTDVDQYVDEWTNIAEPLAKILEMNVYGFDPLITLHTGVNLAPTVSFSPQKAKEIIDKFKTVLRFVG